MNPTDHPLHTTLISLWGLRLLELSLERPPPSPSFPVGDENSPRRRHPWMTRPVRARPLETPRPQSADEHGKRVAGVLNVPYDPAAAGALCGLRRTLRRRIRAAERALAGLAPGAALHPNFRASLAATSALLGLGPDEELCLGLIVMLRLERRLMAAADCLGCEVDDDTAEFALATMLGLPVERIAACFARESRLMASQLFGRDSSGQYLYAKFDWASTGFLRQMRRPGFDPILALRDRVIPAPPATLSWEQFSHLGPITGMLRGYAQRAVKDHRPGVNFLFHGRPGCGKTELARTLAHELGCRLYEVSTEDNDGDPISGVYRLHALRLAQAFACRQPSLVIFDEIEDAFPRGGNPSGGPHRQAPVKGWVNRALETNPTPTCWLTNSVESLDPAFVRRFSVVVEVKAPPASLRAGQLRGLDLDLPPATVSALAACNELAPGVVSRAAEVVRTVAEGNPGLDRDGNLRLLINQTLRAQGHGGLRPAADVDAVYDPAFIRADVDPIGLIDGLRRQPSARLCLAGPPGTGKTAFARHLARELGRPLEVRRVSDLLDKYVGSAERNIAAAFRCAEESGAALLIDEVDSFLQDRTRAERSWEVTQVNEFLTQLESFGGLFLASTNLMQGFDPAALRRFDLKVTFSYLDAGQASRLLAAHLQAAGLPPARPEDEARLGRCQVLTPGDFAAVARQHRFRPLRDGTAWTNALEAECRLKPGVPRGFMGFPAAGGTPQRTLEG